MEETISQGTDHDQKYQCDPDIIITDMRKFMEFSNRTMGVMHLIFDRM